MEQELSITLRPYAPKTLANAGDFVINVGRVLKGYFIADFFAN